MKITNNYDLPQALVDLVQESQYDYTDKHYSATTILNPTRSVLLTKRHFNEIKVDVSDMINMVLGTATHSLIEKFDKTGFAEIYLKEEIVDGYYLTAKCDLYDEKKFELVDYKTATVWKVKFSDFEDWKKQGLIYAWLLIKRGYFVGKLKFHGLLKDWSAREKRIADLKGEFYPECQVYTWEYEVKSSDLNYIEEYIKDRFKEIIECEKLSDEELPDCGKIETWYTGDKFAVYKNVNAERATKLCDTQEEAEGYIQNKMNGKGIVKHRIGEYRRCQDYCSCCEFCKYYAERRAK